MKPAINLWANFLSNEKLSPEYLSPEDTIKIISLCDRLATIANPCIRTHKHKLDSRRLVVTTAFDMGIDLLAMKRPKHSGGTKPAIGRGLLDIWNEEYAKRFGSAKGTSGEAEVRRRGIVTRLSKPQDE